MSEASLWEFAIIFVLALLVIGPERLPAVVKKVGYWVGKGRKFVEKVRSDVESEFRTEDFQRMLSEQSKEIQDLKNIMSEAHTDVRHTVEDMDAALNEGFSDAKEAMKGASSLNKKEALPEPDSTLVETAELAETKKLMSEGSASEESAPEDKPKA